MKRNSRILFPWAKVESATDRRKLVELPQGGTMVYGVERDMIDMVQSLNENNLTVGKDKGGVGICCASLDVAEAEQEVDARADRDDGFVGIADLGGGRNGKEPNR